MITIYSGEKCPFCVSTKKAFDRAGAEYTERMITDDERIEFGKRGHRSLPVVIVKKNGETVDEWAGLRLDKISEWRDAA